MGDKHYGSKPTEIEPSTIHGIDVARNWLEEFAWAQEDEKMIVPTVNTKWLCPPTGVINFNVDVAFSNAYATVDVVDRNASGEVLNAWAKEYVCNDPLQVETYAVLWALYLAKDDHHRRIIVEGDAKLCFDVIHDESSAPWVISPLIGNICNVSKDFISCKFQWVKRDANVVAHAMAKIASFIKNSLYCNFSSLPKPVLEEWRKDIMLLSIF
uniref:RNase H type-1 domain-containing protein n=1 Tax=Fagus sylvatica TaxID=28930 RepID=A0A2N9GHK8_FAGSY